MPQELDNETTLTGGNEVFSEETQGAPTGLPQEESVGEGREKPTASEWTPEKLQELIQGAASLGASQAASQGKSQEPQATKLTQEEVNQRLNTYTVSEATLQDILEGGPKAVSALQSVVEGAVKNATTVAWYQAQYLQQQLQQQYQPLQQFYQEATTDRLREQFFQEYSDLRGHDKLLAAVKLSMESEEAFNGMNQKQAFKALAEKARGILSVTGQTKSPSDKKMATLSRGSQHGSSSAGGTGGATLGTAEAIFGSD